MAGRMEIEGKGKKELRVNELQRKLSLILHKEAPFSFGV
jgi:hypothetical protein